MPSSSGGEAANDVFRLAQWSFCDATKPLFPDSLVAWKPVFARAMAPHGPSQCESKAHGAHAPSSVQLRQRASGGATLTITKLGLGKLHLECSIPCYLIEDLRFFPNRVIAAVASLVSPIPTSFSSPFHMFAKEALQKQSRTVARM